MGRFFLGFAFLLLLLFGLELYQPVQHALILPWTEGIAALSGGLMGLFDSQVTVQGVIIRSTHSDFAIAIRAGCNGVEAVIILAAAIFAFPAGWRYKLAGFALGALTIQVLNLLRIISLFYLGLWNKQVFDWAHLYVWEVLIMLDVLVVFLLWLRLLPAPPAEAHAQTA